MRKPFGDVNYLAIIRIEKFGIVLHECPGTGAHVDNQIIDSSSCAANQFRFFVRCRLIVDAAEGALFLVERNVALNKSWVEAVGFEFTLTPGTSKKAPFILVPVQLNDERAREVCRRKNHE